MTDITDSRERMLPLYEAKMLHQFDHRWATYDGAVARDVSEAEKSDPEFQSIPRYWVAADEVAERMQSRWDSDWLMGWRDIARATDVRTTISATVGADASRRVAHCSCCLPGRLQNWRSH